ncbi:MAG TPA: hypothetical protein DCS91_00860 [Microcoleaceae bacterium UBA11344]|jgi:hypothetical protein|nr:hypothetical protein [Microcoleaceae cyanobacterium UBA11344]
MDENRAQAYLQLIHTLLTCPNGEEPQILQANSELQAQVSVSWRGSSRKKLINRTRYDEKFNLINEN